MLKSVRALLNVLFVLADAALGQDAVVHVAPLSGTNTLFDRFDQSMLPRYSTCGSQRSSLKDAHSGTNRRPRVCY